MSGKSWLPRFLPSLPRSLFIRIETSTSHCLVALQLSWKPKPFSVELTVYQQPPPFARLLAISTTFTKHSKLTSRTSEQYFTTHKEAPWLHQPQALSTVSSRCRQSSSTRSLTSHSLSTQQLKSRSTGGTNHLPVCRSIAHCVRNSSSFTTATTSSSYTLARSHVCG